MKVIDSAEDFARGPAFNVDAERAELQWLLTSGVLGRSTNLARVLRYICEERFHGRASEIKEYTIAVDALGRTPDFDPQTDTIVRVTVHSLRKRLTEIYENEAAERGMRVMIPHGHYAPWFLPNEPGTAVPSGVELVDSPQIEPAASAPPRWGDPVHFSSLSPGVAHRRWMIATAFIAVLIAGWGLTRLAAKRGPVAGVSAATTGTPPPDTIHALLGNGRKAYKDHSGEVWSPGRYCQGGSSVPVLAQKIAGTEDPELYRGGIRGIAHCIFPVKSGNYELHFFFAETSDLPAVTRPVTLTINAGPDISFDVVDRAGGDGIATSTVATGVTPENDGTIRVDYVSEISLLNAVEILPAPSPQLLPVRIVAASHSFVDDKGQVWLSDRYFKGGRRGQTPVMENVLKPGLFSSDRVGEFSYDIPVVPFEHYQVKLYFRELWFAAGNGGMGGPGSRVFNVSCNGEPLLKDFDILAEAGNSPIVKTFDHIQASATGRIDLSFLPVVNYPVVNAIEIIPED